MAAYNRKKDILIFAWQVITRNGIRAFRVEEAVRAMGMSKRTVYRWFPTKTDLLKTCLVEMNREFYNGQMSENLQEEDDPFTKLMNFLKKYMDRLYQVETVFLTELKQLPEFTGVYQSQREEWLTRTEKLITACQQAGYVLPDTDLFSFCERLLITLFESRLDAVSYEVQYRFIYTLLRGISTSAGITRLEEIKAEMPELS